MPDKVVSKNQLRRLPQYLNYLIAKADEGMIKISSTKISTDLNLSEEKVRKDIALVSKKSGVPGKGRNITELITDIKEFLGYNKAEYAVLVGCGSLGKALLGYPGFENYGLKIIAAFDSNDDLDGMIYGNKPVYKMDKLEEFCKQNPIKIGVICVPKDSAQSVCDMFIKCGILAIWNFAPIHLNVNDNIIVLNEDMGSSLAILSNKMHNLEV